MIRLTRKQRVLGGALVLAGLVWAADHFLGSGQPATLRAAQAAAAPPPVAAASWQDLSDSVARLSRNEYLSVADDIDQLPRDLFESTPLMDATFAAVEPPPSAALAAAAEKPTDQDSDFRTRHKLEGVLLGQTPLAVIDGQVLAVHSDLDDYTLIEVQRDWVVFQQPATGARVVLELAQRPKTP